MHNTTPRFELDSHIDSVLMANIDLGDHELPEPPESWSLTDFEDIVPGRA